MRKLLMLMLLIVSSTLFANAEAGKLLLTTNSQNYFVENKGQWDQEVKYLVQMPDMNAWITDNGVVYDYYQIVSNYSEEDLLEIPESKKEKYKEKNSFVNGHIVRTLFQKNNSSQQFSGDIKQESYFNYFLGKDESKWASNVRLYKGATVKELYNGIDIKYYFDKGSLRYDYIVKPGADISQISIALVGVENFSVNQAGELEIQTSLGLVRHQDIYAYQKNSAGGEQKVQTSFKQTNKGTISFVIENYDKNKELIIDPLVFSTFLGGGSLDLGESIKLDGNKNIFISGYTASSSFPTTSGAYQEDISTIHDVFVSKLNADGTALIYSTFLGGNDNEKTLNTLVLDQNGNPIIAGITGSNDFPTTTNAFQPNYAFNDDAFVTKLNEDGTSLVFSTYFGGSNYDEPTSLAIDNLGNIFLAGATKSTNLPTSTNAYQASKQNNYEDDIFIVKLNNNASSLELCTYLGGTDYEVRAKLVLDENANIFVSGETASADFPTTENAFQVSLGSGFDRNVFVCKLNPTVTELVFSTCIGSKYTYTGASAIQIDSESNVYIAGTTTADDFPVTQGAYQTVEGYAYSRNSFITKFNSTGTEIIVSTYFSGKGNDIIRDMLIDNENNIFVIGSSTSDNFPTTEGALQTEINGQHDMFISVFNPSISALTYSTLLGGKNNDYPYSFVLDSNKDLYITGETSSSDFPITEGAYRSDLENDRYNDAFIIKIQPTFVETKIVEELMPLNYCLQQNYPNPFNPRTTIAYDVKSPGFVSLKIYNVLGEEVENLVNGEQLAGSYSVNFNASSLSTGIYFYKLTADNFMSVKKMSLVK